MIRTTGEHPFYAEDLGWTACRDLRPGQRILSESSATWLTIERVAETDAWETVYNFRVADWHTYFVGGDVWGWAAWAHNSNYGGRLTAAEKASVKELTSQAVPVRDAIRQVRAARAADDVVAPNSGEFVSGWRRLSVNDVPLPSSVSKTFPNGEAVGRVLAEDTIMYRVAGGSAGRQGGYLTRVRPASTQDAVSRLALVPEWGNTAGHLVEVRVPKGTVIWEGTVASKGALPGGGNQVWISPDQLWHMSDELFRFIPW